MGIRNVLFGEPNMLVSFRGKLILLASAQKLYSVQKHIVQNNELMNGRTPEKKITMFGSLQQQKGCNIYIWKNKKKHLRFIPMTHETKGQTNYFNI